MAWICFDLDGCLIQQAPMESQDEPPQGDEIPVEGAVEFCTQLSSEGHRLTIHTSRFAPMPESERNRLKQQIEQQLAGMGFPMMEVWTGTTKPDADLFIGPKNITLDGDFGLVMAQLQMMIQEQGLDVPSMQDQEELPQEGDGQ